MSEESLRKNGATCAVLSFTAPGPDISGTIEGARALARQTNIYLSQLRDEKPDTFAFFCSVPSPFDKEGCLQELNCAFDTLNADGIILLTRYGEGDNYYLGHPKFDYLWEELNKRESTVFTHPCAPLDPRLINRKLLLPTIDYTHETSRAAMDLLVNGNRRRFPKCKIILSHAGGTLPYIITRPLSFRKGVPVEKIPDGVTYEQFLEEFRSFYFDLAVSSAPQVLDCLLKMVPHDHVLYGKHLLPMSEEKRRHVLTFLPRLRLATRSTASRGRL